MPYLTVALPPRTEPGLRGSGEVVKVARLLAALRVRYILAMLPILAVLVLMIWRRWGAHQAGAVGWLVCLSAGAVGFGINPELFWVSQAKGLLLSVFVLAVMWPALLLYHWIDAYGGIQAVAHWLAGAIPNRGMCLLLLAWALSGLLEGLAGFGLPIAVVAPMLVALKVSPVRAVMAVAVGHSWSVTFGDMGVIIQTLSAVVSIPVSELVPWAGTLLGVACLICGLMSAFILGQAEQWLKVAALSVVMGLVQYGVAAAGLIPLSAFTAGLAGMLVYVGWTRVWRRYAAKPQAPEPDQPAQGSRDADKSAIKAARLAIACYGGLTLLMAVLTLVPSFRAQSLALEWKLVFPEVTSAAGFSTPAGPGQIFRPLAHPGTLILTVALLSMAAAGRSGFARARKAAAATTRSARLASVGILFMVGISTLMDHSGMSYVLAQGLSAALGTAYPLVSPCVGILGAFATGSNNNSNVLFGNLQKNVALLLQVNPQLAGGCADGRRFAGEHAGPGKDRGGLQHRCAGGARRAGIAQDRALRRGGGAGGRAACLGAVSRALTCTGRHSIFAPWISTYPTCWNNGITSRAR